MKANVALISHQVAELQNQSAENEAMNAASKELGDLFSAMISASDFSGDGLTGDVRIAEILQRNKYQEIRISELQEKLEDLTEPSYYSMTSEACCER